MSSLAAAAPTHSQAVAVALRDAENETARRGRKE
jgi:hypothetical protein